MTCNIQIPRKVFHGLEDLRSGENPIHLLNYSKNFLFKHKKNQLLLEAGQSNFKLSTNLTPYISPYYAL